MVIFVTDAILHLGGNIKRLEETIRQAQLHPDAQIIISSEDSIQEAVNQLKWAGIQRERVVLNPLAYDTPGNFTTTYGDVRRAGARRVYVVTDQFHMKRSIALASACYCGTGIQPIPCPYLGSPLYEEPAGWTVGGVSAVMLWRATGIVYVPAAIKNARSQWWQQAQIEYRNVAWNS